MLWGDSIRASSQCFQQTASAFRSRAKYYSGIGHPTFVASYGNDKNILRVQDTRFGLSRVEVRCKRCQAHLGHISEDKASKTGECYTINSVSINFIKQ